MSASGRPNRAGPRLRLFTPGPVEIPDRILRALAQPPPHHRTAQFRETMLLVNAQLRELHGTAGEMYLLAASGTGAMEAAVVNLMNPGEKALAVVAGKFGQRWERLLEAHRVPHDALVVEWGRSVTGEALAARLDADPAIRAVFATHSETSAGSLHDVEAFARITRPKGVRLVVDGITSVGVHPLTQDAWGVDVVVCGSQKGLMVPPGIATLSLAPWAVGAIEDGLPRFYFDLRRARRGLMAGDTAFTPPVSLVLALEESLAMIREEGLAKVHERHERLARATRAGAMALGFRVFPERPSHAVTALAPPPGLEAAAVVQRLLATHGMVIGGGQDELRGRIIRIGHMGAYALADIEALMRALQECVTALGRPARGAVEAAREAWVSD